MDLVKNLSNNKFLLAQSANIQWIKNLKITTLWMVSLVMDS